MKRILVCGSNGLLGQQLAWMLKENQEFEVLHTSHHRSFYLGNIFDYTQLDITNRSDVKSLVSSYRPDVVLNAAAMSNVDVCEREREAAWKANVIGVENLAETARRIGAKLIHVSTDYVFDGKSGPYSESDRTNPINYYGKTKLAGENVLLGSAIDYAIVRTIVVYGAGKNIKNNFALWVINSLKQNKTIRCYIDQISNPTFVQDLAQAIISAVQYNAKGLYHICGCETLSRYEFARKIANIFNLDSSLINEANSGEVELPAQRPRITGFKIEKAKKDLHYSPMRVAESLKIMRHQIDGISLN